MSSGLVVSDTQETKWSEITIATSRLQHHSITMLFRYKMPSTALFLILKGENYSP